MHQNLEIYSVGWLFKVAHYSQKVEICHSCSKLNISVVRPMGFDLEVEGQMVPVVFYRRADRHHVFCKELHTWKWVHMRSYWSSTGLPFCWAVAQQMFIEYLLCPRYSRRQDQQGFCVHRVDILVGGVAGSGLLERPDPYTHAVHVVRTIGDEIQSA